MVKEILVILALLAAAIVFGAAPSLTQVVLTTSEGLNYTTGNLSFVLINVTDADNDTVFNITDWRLNGASHAIFNMPAEQHSSNASLTAKDYSQSNNTGTVNEAVFNATGGRDGRGTYIFDGSNDYISFTTSFATQTGTDPFAVEAWAYADDLSGAQSSYGMGIVKSHTTSTGQAGDFRLSVDNAGAVVFVNIQAAGTGSALHKTTTGVISEDTWHHIVAMWDGKHNRIYVNGEFEPIVSTGDSASGWIADTTVGRLFSAAHYTWNGRLDDILVYDHALSEKYIESRYLNQYHLIPSTVTVRDQNWSVCVTPNDGLEEGSAVCSNNVTIIDEAPTVGAITLTSSQGKNQSRENISVSVVGESDPENASLDHYTDWRVNGRSQLIANVPVVLTDNGSLSDLSTNQDTGTVNGAGFRPTAGHDGGAAYFYDATDDYISFANGWSSLINQGPFTIEAWAYATSLASANTDFGQGIVKSHQASSGTTGDFRLSVDNDGAVRFVNIRPSGTGTALHFTADGVIDPGRWYHYVATWNGTHNRLYINGTHIPFIGNASSAPSWGVDTTIGRMHSSTFYHWEGYIDDVRIYNRSLLQSEAQLLYTQGTTQQHNSATSVGQKWQACVTSTDGFYNLTTCSGNLTVNGRLIASQLNNLSYIGSISGNLLDGDGSSDDEFITIQQNGIPKMRVFARFSSTDVNLTGAFFNSTGARTYGNVSQATGVNQSFSLYVIDEGIGVTVCPTATDVSQIQVTCPNATHFSPSEIASATTKSGFTAVLENGNIRIDNITGTGITTGTDANLTIFDEVDVEGGGLTKFPLDPVSFFANYTTTSGAPLNASCNITIESLVINDSMSFNATGNSIFNYTYSAGFAANGTYNWSVSCINFDGLTNLSATDTVFISSTGEAVPEFSTIALFAILGLVMGGFLLMRRPPRK